MHAAPPRECIPRTWQLDFAMTAWLSFICHTSLDGNEPSQDDRTRCSRRSDGRRIAPEDTVMRKRTNASASRAAWAIVAAALAGVAGGCAVGPDFQHPPPPGASRYTEAPLPAQTESSPVTGGAAQHFVAGDLPAQWWSLFRSDALD